MTLRDERGLLYLATGAECRRLDRHTIEELELPGRVLMERAGQGAADAIMERTGRRPGHAVVLCGGGNNGGDGYVVARALADSGWTTHCLALQATDSLEGDAASNHALYLAVGGSVSTLGDCDVASVAHVFDGATVIVDGLFGTGLSRPIEGRAAELLAFANDMTGVMRVALDVPSGVCADTGGTLGVPFHADLTTTFGLAKLGLAQHPGAKEAGEVVVVPIGFPTVAVEQARLAWRSLDGEAVAARLPARLANGHKGSFGHVGVVGGFAGMGGAASLTALAALRSGCGLVTWNGPATPDVVQRPPEVLLHDVSLGLDTRSGTLAVGPGLGRSTEAMAIVQAACRSGRGLVLDADALNILADQAEPNWPTGAVLTPHPAEAARLLGISTQEVQANRPEALGALVAQTGCVVVLKGARTLVGGLGRPGVTLTGDAPALAVAGSGDVLTGLIAGLMAQGVEPFDAALCACWLHVVAGRRLGARQGERGVMATEIATAIPALVGELQSGWLA